MAEHQIPAHGTFCWNELSTNNVEAAKQFYSELLGWKLHQSDTTNMPYIEIEAGGRHIGGMYQQSPDCGGPTSPHWMAYVAVDAVDGVAARVESLGGKVCV